jgi:hypothetical protein
MHIGVSNTVYRLLQSKRLSVRDLRLSVPTFGKPYSQREQGVFQRARAFHLNDRDLHLTRNSFGCLKGVHSTSWHETSPFLPSACQALSWVCKQNAGFVVRLLRQIRHRKSYNHVDMSCSHVIPTSKLMVWITRWTRCGKLVCDVRVSCCILKLINKTVVH